MDIVPTLLELANAKTSSDAPPAPGKSLSKSFETDSSIGHDSIWWFHDGHKAIRMGDWKAVAPVAEPWELYHLAEDRVESNDLAVVRREKLAELTSQWQRQTDAYIELATSDLSKDVLAKAKHQDKQPKRMSQAQQAARPKRGQALHNAETFFCDGRHAFLMKPKVVDENTTGKPWIFYAPTLKPYPDKAESWMHRKFLAAGVAVAGIDVGESYRSPHAFPSFDALYNEMIARGYSEKPALLGRSRGGLWVSSWAIEHPNRVAGLGGIYPVYDYTTYPGVARAANAYGTSAEQLLTRQAELNPIKRIGVLARAKIPVLIIHGTDDKVVPIAENSSALVSAYEKHNAANQVTLIKAEGQGHSFWPGFFQCQELVDFLIEKAKAENESVR